MILYRALIDEDLIEIRKTGKISCTLLRSYNYLKDCKNIRMTKKMYDICYKQKNKGNILSFIYGHTSGQLVRAKRSPWISLTSSFEVAYRYAKIDETKRRNIICFEVDNNDIINNSKDFKTKNITNGAIINLSNGQISEYRDKNIIIPYNGVKNKKRNSRIFMHSAFSMRDKHYVICYELKPKNYKLLNQKEQDNLKKASNENINDAINKILQNKINKGKQLVKKCIKTP